MRSIVEFKRCTEWKIRSQVWKLVKFSNSICWMLKLISTISALYSILYPTIHDMTKEMAISWFLTTVCTVRHIRSVSKHQKRTFKTEKKNIHSLSPTCTVTIAKICNVCFVRAEQIYTIIVPSIAGWTALRSAGLSIQGFCGCRCCLSLSHHWVNKLVIKNWSRQARFGKQTKEKF